MNYLYYVLLQPTNHNSVFLLFLAEGNSLDVSVSRSCINTLALASNYPVYLVTSTCEESTCFCELETYKKKRLQETLSNPIFHSLNVQGMLAY